MLDADDKRRAKDKVLEKGKRYDYAAAAARHCERLRKRQEDALETKMVAMLTMDQGALARNFKLRGLAKRNRRKMLDAGKLDTLDYRDVPDPEFGSFLKTTSVTGEEMKTTLLSLD